MSVIARLVRVVMLQERLQWGRERWFFFWWPLLRNQGLLPCPSRAQGQRNALACYSRSNIAGTTRVMSPLWTSYDCLQDERYESLTVNHNLNTVDPDTGPHTQGIENTWWGVKRSYPVQEHPKNFFERYLQEFLWRKR